MRNSRRLRPDALNTPICTATEPASITLRPQMSDSSSCVLVVSASSASAAPMPERADVAHEDPRRRGVPPQEAAARAGERGGEHGEVERVDHDAVDLSGCGSAQ